MESSCTILCSTNPTKIGVRCSFLVFQPFLLHLNSHCHCTIGCTAARAAANKETGPIPKVNVMVAVGKGLSAFLQIGVSTSANLIPHKHRSLPFPCCFSSPKHDAIADHRLGANYAVGSRRARSPPASSWR